MIKSEFWFFFLHGITTNTYKKKMSTCKFSTDVKFYCGTIKYIRPVLENSYDHKISDWGAIVIKFLSKTHGDIIKIGHLTKGTYSHNCHFFPYLIWI